MLNTIYCKLFDLTNNPVTSDYTICKKKLENMSQIESYTIIGISGCTNSGKTSMTGKLMKMFNGSTYMCQDSYFFEPGDDRLEYVEEVQHNNWEKLSALDMAKLVRDVKQWIKASQTDDYVSSMLFVEGYTIFNYWPLWKLCHKKYFLSMDFNICQQRRLKRNYCPADPVGYFEKVAWPMYLSNKAEIQHYNDIVYFDGCDPQEKTIKSILVDLQTIPNLIKLHNTS